MFDVLWGCIQSNLDYLILSDTEYDPLANSNLSLHFGADILNVLNLYDFFAFYV